MRNLTAFAFTLALIAACSGRSQRTAFRPGSEPETGGSLGAAGEGANGGDGPSSSGGGPQAGRAASGGSATGGSDGRAGTSTGARGGDAAMGASAGEDGRGARGGSDGSGATAAMAGQGATAGMNSAGAGGSNPVTSCNEDFGFLGTWEGHRLDFFFEPMERVVLEFAADEAGIIHGTMTWGEPGEPLPEPVDGDTPYPPGYWEEAWSMDGSGNREPLPGVPYTIVRGAGCDSTLRFGIATAETFDEWCGFMQPVYTEGLGWGCTLQGGGSLNEDECVAQTSSGQSASYPTWKCLACGIGASPVCACDEQRCFSNREADRTFSLSVSESEGKTVLSGPDASCGDCTLRLTRAE